MCICKKCGKEFQPTKGLINYCTIQCRNSRTFNEETNIKKSIANKNQIPWNKGKESKWVITKCLGCGDDIKHLKYKIKKYHPECWLKFSGGYRKGSGVGKKGWYKGYWCDSSYELAWVIYNLEHNFYFVRNKEKYSYIWENKIRKYTPDFIKNGDLIEIKGYVDNHTQAKLNSVPNIKILFRKDLDVEFNYVIKKYGKDFIKLYEK